MQKEENSFRLTPAHRAALQALVRAAKREREEAKKQANQQEQAEPSTDEKGGQAA